MTTTIIRADYHNPSHAKDIGYALNCYARDPFGGGAALPKEITENIASELAKRDHAFSLIAYVDEECAGLINCFELFSTFMCKPFINIHDIVVIDQFRGRGLSLDLISAVETVALERGCCKLTLEVLSNNDPAKAAYRKFGFREYQLQAHHGHALYWEKKIGPNT